MSADNNNQSSDSTGSSNQPQKPIVSAVRVERRTGKLYEIKFHSAAPKKGDDKRKTGKKK